MTAGNTSGINDGAAAVVLMERKTAEKRGAKPMGRLVAYALAGVDPKIMGIGPVPATRLALQRAGLALADIDVIESNEAFAAQACAVPRTSASIRRRQIQTGQALRSAIRSAQQEPS